MITLIGQISAFIISEWLVLPANVLHFQQTVKLCLLSALHSHYSCDRVPSAPLEEDVDGCQATAYRYHPLHPLDVNDSEMSAVRLRMRMITVSYYEREVRLPGT